MTDERMTLDEARAVAERTSPLPQDARRALQAAFAEVDRMHKALCWVLWRHQGASSSIGQPVRFALRMGQYERMSDAQVALAKRYAEWSTAVASASLAAGVSIEFALTVIHELRLRGWPINELATVAESITDMRAAIDAAMTNFGTAPTGDVVEAGGCAPHVIADPRAQEASHD